MNGGGFVRLAEAYRQEGLLDDAERILREGLVREPGSIPGRVALAQLWLERSAFDDALAEANRIEALAPGSLEALELKAQILWRRRAAASPSRTEERQGEPLTGSAAGPVTSTLAALYAAQGYPERAAALRGRLAAEPEAAQEAVPPAGATSLLDRLAAFREAARRRREELRS